jgi:predicted RNase H-like nuclease (RuvC/YqgF family)
MARAPSPDSLVAVCAGTALSDDDEVPADVYAGAAADGAHLFELTAEDCAAATAEAQRAAEAEDWLKELEEALDGVSESSQAELARLKKCVDGERNKTMTLVDDLDAARDENEQLAEALATATGERRHDAENLQKLADALAASNAERQQLHGNLKQLAEGLVAATAAFAAAAAVLAVGGSCCSIGVLRPPPPRPLERRPCLATD